MRIRPMESEDLSCVMEVDSEAWSRWLFETTGKNERVTPRSKATLQMYMESDPEGSLLAEEGGRIVGYGFARRFGALGCIGPIAVHPKSQGKRFGKRITEACVDYLLREGAETVGLETMPQTPKNLNLYTKLGFRTAGLSYFMQRKPATKENRTRSRLANLEITITPAKNAIPKIRKVCAESLGGIDYSREAHFVEKYENGKILLASHNKECIGFAICYPFKRPNQNTRVFVVKFSTIIPNYNNDPHPNAFIRPWKDIAKKCGCAAVCARCYSANHLSLNRLISQGYMIYNSHVKMYKGKPLLNDIKTFHIEQWGG